MDKKTEALKLALEALEPVSTFGRVGSRDVDTAKAQQAIAAIKEALAQPKPLTAERLVEIESEILQAGGDYAQVLRAVTDEAKLKELNI